MDIATTLSHNMMAIRKAYGLSIANFADMLGVAKSTLQQIEHGNLPNLATLVHIADKLCIPTQALLSAEYDSHMDLIMLLLRGYNWFFELPQERQLVFSNWMRSQLDTLIQFTNEQTT